MSARRLGLILLAAVCAAGLFFHTTVRSGFHLLPGSWVDGGLHIGLCEHVPRVVDGTAAWRDPGMFYPRHDILGRSDVMLGQGLLYSLLRLLGLAPESAHVTMLMLLAVAGFFGFHQLARRVVGTGPAAALAGAFLFVNLAPFATALRNGHAQLLCAWLIPWLVVAAAAAGTANRATTRILAAVAFGLGVGLLVLSSFYTAWFFLFWTGLGVVLYGLIQPRALLRSARGHRNALLAAGAGLALMLIPVSLIHGPAWLEYTPRHWSDVIATLPNPRDFLNTGMHPLFWTGVPQPPGDVLAHERAYGLPPLTLLAMLAALAYLARRAAPAWRVLLALVGLGWLLMLNFGGWSPWAMVHQFAPGAGALRAIFRAQLVLSLPLALAFTAALDLLLRRPACHQATSALGWLALTALLVLENFSPVQNMIPRSELAARRLATPPPPPDAQSFFLAPWDQPSASPEEGQRAQIACFLLAQTFNVPTLNGYTGAFPSDWNLHDPSAPGYRAAVLDWLDRYGLQQVYALDLARGHWRGPFSAATWAQELPPCPRGTNLVAQAGALAPYVVHGSAGADPGLAWSVGNAATWLFPFTGTLPRTLRFRATAFLAPGHTAQTARLLVNGSALTTLTFRTEQPWQEGHLDLPPALFTSADDGPLVLLRLTVLNDHPARPSELGISSDQRRLGLGWTLLSID